MAVVKASSYGSDSVIISKKLEEEKIDYLAVAYVSEGIKLRNEGVKTPILVLHPQINDFDKIIDYNLEPSIYSFRILKAFINNKKFNKNYLFQIKFNSGLNRLGFNKKDIGKLVESLGGLKPNFIFSHLGASEDLSELPYTNKQIETFSLMSELFENKIGSKISLDISCICNLCFTAFLLKSLFFIKLAAYISVNSTSLIYPFNSSSFITSFISFNLYFFLNLNKSSDLLLAL